MSKGAQRVLTFMVTIGMAFVAYLWLSDHPSMGILPAMKYDVYAIDERVDLIEAQIKGLLEGRGQN